MLEWITQIFSTLQDKQNEYSLNIGFDQLVQKLDWITPVISSLQDKQNEWSLYRVSSIGLRVMMIFQKGKTY